MKIFKALIVLVLGVVITALILAADIYTYPRGKVRDRADAAIVLGAAIWTDRPSPVFRERLNHALQLYKDGKIKKIILTGGFGEGEKFSEAEIGERYLIENGVPAVDLYKETQSRTTYQNLENSVRLLTENDLRSVLIVSDPLHLRRSVLVAERLGLEAYPSATPTSRYQSFWSQLKFLSREVYFYGRFLLFGN